VCIILYNFVLEETVKAAPYPQEEDDDVKYILIRKK